MEERQLTTANETTNRKGQLMSNLGQLGVANPDDTSSQRLAKRDGLDVWCLTPTDGKCSLTQLRTLMK